VIDRTRSEFTEITVAGQRLDSRQDFLHLYGLCLNRLELNITHFVLKTTPHHLLLQQKTLDIKMTSRVTLFLSPAGLVREPDVFLGHLLLTGRSSDLPAP